MITTRWVKHLRTDEERKEFIKRLENGEDIFFVLRNILEEELNKSSKERRSLKSYMFQNWSEYQADRNATERTILEIIDLLP